MYIYVYIHRYVKHVSKLLVMTKKKISLEPTSTLLAETYAYTHQHTIHEKMT